MDELKLYLDYDWLLDDEATNNEFNKLSELGLDFPFHIEMEK